jgi:serine/threonine protein kinase
MYNKISNPYTNKLVSINSKLGKEILSNYVKQLGGKINFTLDGINYKYSGDAISSACNEFIVTERQFKIYTNLDKIIPFINTSNGKCVTYKKENINDIESFKNKIDCIGKGDFGIGLLGKCTFNNNNNEIILKLFAGPNITNKILDNEIDINLPFTESFPFVTNFLGYIDWRPISFNLQKTTEIYFSPKNLFAEEKKKKINRILSKEGTSNKTVALFFEKLNGKYNDLDKFWKRLGHKFLNIDIINSLYLVLDLLFAIKYLRTKNIYHCDIKPDNVAYGSITLENGERYNYYQLIDFGCSLKSEEEQQNCSHSECGLKNWKQNILLWPIVCKDKRITLKVDNDIQSIALLFKEQFMKKHKIDFFCDDLDDPNNYLEVKNKYNINISILLKIILNMFSPKKNEINNVDYYINLFFDDSIGLFNDIWKKSNEISFENIKGRYNKLLENSVGNIYLFPFL